jgi:hypothetical protein
LTKQTELARAALDVALAELQLSEVRESAAALAARAGRRAAQQRAVDALDRYTASLRDADDPTASLLPPYLRRPPKPRPKAKAT